MTELESAIHHLILRNLIDKGHAPSLTELSDSVAVDSEEIQNVLLRLQEQHALVLRPDQKSIWVIHPFSTTPTNFWIEDKSGNGWWGNCIWCSLGAAYLTSRDVVINTSYGAEGERAQLAISDGSLKADFQNVGHFPKPIARAWEDVHFFCSTCLLFKNEEQVHEWCNRHGFEFGKTIAIQKIWELARVWYGSHLDEDWKKPSGKRVNQMFASVGLTDPFWSVPESQEHY